MNFFFTFNILNSNLYRKNNAGNLSSPSANLSNSTFSFSKEYSNFNKLCNSVVSKAKAKCFSASGNAVSVKITLVQYDLFFILSQFSISEI